MVLQLENNKKACKPKRHSPLGLQAFIVKLSAAYAVLNFYYMFAII